MTTPLVAALAIVALLPAPLQQRDRPQPVPTGTAVVSGIVTTDAEKPVPLRKARVTLSSAELNFNRTIVTDETGRFAFTSLPAGRFTLSVMKEAFVTMAYGARRPGRPGTSLLIADGAKITGLTMRLPRGAVISGVITDWMGRPQPDVQASAMQYVYLNGMRRLLQQGSALTDDRGAFRIFGLRAGQYVVSASASRTPSFQSTPDLLQVSEADVDRVLQEAQRSAPGEGSATLPSSGVGRRVTYASVFFPNVTSPGQATLIDVGAGEERTGIDIQLALVPSGRVEGSVSYADGPMPGSVQVTLVSAGAEPAATMDGFRFARVGADGKFQFGAVPPGEYVLTARATVAGAESALWAIERVFIDGDSTPSVTLELRRGFTVAGRIEFEATGPAPQDARGWRVGLTPVMGPGEVGLGVSAVNAEPDGRFTIHGVTPGRYRVQPTPPSAPLGDRWMARSAMFDARNMLEEGFQIQGDVDGVVVTCTDRIPQISGTLQDASGGPASDYHIIVFPADRALWLPQSPRIQAVRPSTDGKYIVKKLPPGEYLMVAMIDVEPNEWGDPAFLQRIASAAMTFTLGEGEQKVQDLTLKGG